MIENPNSESTKIDFSFIYFNNSAFAQETVSQETGWINYTSNNSDGSNLNTKIPTGWQIIEDKTRQVNQTTNNIVFLSPKENPSDLFQENIVLSVQRPTNNISMEDGVDTQDIVEKLGNQYDNFRFENMSSIILDNSKISAESIVYSFADAGLLFKTKQVFLTTNSGIYIFSLLAEQDQYDKYVIVFDRVLKNIKLTN
ncbi:hypothetical protein [Candidatus Nitrosocosmicus sp. FF01]|uniref:hypothetical protein n=1 Tax=Candidatus Nitrosocosmicus sp. FF01 TaxID=3397670 RepID=UPI0039ED80A2